MATASTTRRTGRGTERNSSTGSPSMVSGGPRKVGGRGEWAFASKLPAVEFELNDYRRPGWLSDEQAAVDGDRGPGDVGRLIREQIGDGVGDVVWSPDPAEGDPGFETGQHLLRHSPHHRRVDGARADGVDANAPARDLKSQ